MECEVCMEELDLEERRPKALPCGHTTCLRCLLGLKDRRCPQCRREIRGAVSSVPDNYFVISYLDQFKNGLSPRRGAGCWWCVDCSRVAASGCAAGHTVRGLGAALRRQLQDLLPQAGRRLQDLQEEDALRACAEGQLLDALELLAGPAADSAADCLLTVQRGDSVYTAHWGAEGAQDALLQALVAALAVKGKLTKVGGEADAPESPPAAGAAAAAAKSPSPLRYEPTARPSVYALAGLAGLALSARRTTPLSGTRNAPIRVDSPATPRTPPTSSRPAASSPFAEASLPATAAAPRTFSKPIHSLSAKTLSNSAPYEFRGEKRETIKRVQREGVRRLMFINGDTDPAWVSELLEASAPSVTHLNLWQPRPEHLAKLRSMVHLRRLDLGVNALRDALAAGAPPAVDFGYGGRLPAGQGIVRLRVKGEHGLPRDMLVALLRVHRDTLEELELQVGTPGEVADVTFAWPDKCNDLHILLRDCHLSKLRKLELIRTHEDDRRQHRVRACARQTSKLRAALPGVEIHCDSMDCQSDSELSDEGSNDGWWH